MTAEAPDLVLRRLGDPAQVSSLEFPSELFEVSTGKLQISVPKTAD